MNESQERAFMLTQLLEAEWFTSLQEEHQILLDRASIALLYQIGCHSQDSEGAAKVSVIGPLHC